MIETQPNTCVAVELTLILKQIYLSRSFHPPKRRTVTSVEGRSVKSNSFCAASVKLRSALQHALNFPPKLAAACYKQQTSKDSTLQPET